MLSIGSKRIVVTLSSHLNILGGSSGSTRYQYFDSPLGAEHENIDQTSTFDEFLSPAFLFNNKKFLNDFGVAVGVFL